MHLGDYALEGYHTGDERVGSGFERSEAVANYENAGAEAAKGLGLDAGNSEQGANAVEGQAPDEDGTISIMTKDPGGMANGGEGIGSK